MDMSFYMPVNVITGEGCVLANAGALALGKHAFIVTGRTSARASGALSDVTSALDRQGIRYTLFDRASENPLASMCREGGEACRQAGADFVIGIGGGSALDAAKAVAAFAVCPDADTESIFDADFDTHKILPIAAIPTTSGTGSEANAYAVLTLDDGIRKKTLKHIPGTYPRVSFVDPRYTYSLNEHYTVSTALDALSHAIESYLSPKSNEASEMYAAFAAKHIWDVLFDGADGEGEKDAGGFTPTQRRRLSMASMAAGIAINRTGTGFPHPMGYSITLSDGIPHGRACGAFEGAYIEYNMRTETGARKLTALAGALGTTPAEMARRIPLKADVKLVLTDDQMEEYISRITQAAGFMNSPYVLSDFEKKEIYGKLFSL